MLIRILDWALGRFGYEIVRREETCSGVGGYAPLSVGLHLPALDLTPRNLQVKPGPLDGDVLVEQTAAMRSTE